MNKGKRFFVALCCIVAVAFVLSSTSIIRAKEQEKNKSYNVATTKEKRSFNPFRYFNIFKRSHKVNKDEEASKPPVTITEKQKSLEKQEKKVEKEAAVIAKKEPDITEKKKETVVEEKLLVVEKKDKTKKKKKKGKKVEKKKGKEKKVEKKEEKKTEKKVEKEKPAQVVEQIDPTDPSSIIYLGEKGGRRSTGDIVKSGYASEAMRLGAGWHPKAIDAKVIPRDKFGLVNWVELVNKKAIQPKGSLDPNYKEPMPFNLNILFKMKGGFTDNVIFPHDLHTYWLDCINCHNKIFFQFAGWNDVKMTEIAQGEWCGRCHGIVAFPITDCTRCHKYPKGHEIEKTATKRKPKPKKKK